MGTLDTINRDPEAGAKGEGSGMIGEPKGSTLGLTIGTGCLSRGTNEAPSRSEEGLRKRRRTSETGPTTTRRATITERWHPRGTEGGTVEGTEGGNGEEGTKEDLPIEEGGGGEGNLLGGKGTILPSLPLRGMHPRPRT